MPLPPILAFCGAPATPSELWLRWTMDPFLVAGLLLAVLGLGWLGRGQSVERRLALYGGWTVTALAFVSPLCALAVALFAARAAQHMLLVLVAAPLLAWGLPGTWGRRHGFAALLSFTALFWLWHLPGPYDAALRYGGLYWASHLSLLVASVLLWRSLLPGATPSAFALGAAASAQMGLLGAVLVFAPAPLYASHLLSAPIWGLTPLHDQQLGGLLMWVPGSLGFLVAGVVGVMRLLQRPTTLPAA